MTSADTPDALEELRGMYASDRDNYDERGIIGHRITRFIVSPEAVEELARVLTRADVDYKQQGIEHFTEEDRQECVDADWSFMEPEARMILLLLAQKGLGK